MVHRLIFVMFLLFNSTLLLGNTRLLEHDGYIVKYKNPSSQLKSNTCFMSTSKTCELLETFKIKVIKTLPKNLKIDPNIEYIEPNWIYHTMYTPGDEKFSQQWALKKIQAERAWEFTLGNEIIVAVIDTGIDYTHPDLKDQMWINEAELNGKPGVDDDGNGYVDDIYGYDFVNKDGDPKDDHNHGTHCAGIIGAQHNSLGIAGVSTNVKLMALKFLSASGSGSAEDAILAVKYAVDHGAKVLSNSWGGGGASQAMVEAIEYAKSKGVMFVAAAGNEYSNNDSNPAYPASYKISNVISVAASDINDNKADFSNYGESVHIAAPGKDILSTVRGGYASYSGTSMACPYVSGALAMLLSYENLSLEEAKNRLIYTSDYLENWEGLTFNAGRLNLYNLISNKYPVRPPAPDEDLWVSYDVSIETPHPYADSKTYEYEIAIPSGSEFLRIHFSSFDTESKYDIVSVIAGSKILKYDGNKGTFYTKYLKVSGLDKVVIKLVTDSSQTRNGFIIDHFQVQ